MDAGTHTPLTQTIKISIFKGCDVGVLNWGRGKYNTKDTRRRNYLMLGDWEATCTTTKAFRMEKCPHASQIVAITNVPVAATTYSAS